MFLLLYQLRCNLKLPQQLEQDILYRYIHGFIEITNYLSITQLKDFKLSGILLKI